jgi:hypothetical protein
MIDGIVEVVMSDYIQINSLQLQFITTVYSVGVCVHFKKQRV